MSSFALSRSFRGLPSPAQFTRRMFGPSLGNHGPGSGMAPAIGGPTGRPIEGQFSSQFGDVSPVDPFGESKFLEEMFRRRRSTAPRGAALLPRLSGAPSLPSSMASGFSRGALFNSPSFGGFR